MGIERKAGWWAKVQKRKETGNLPPEYLDEIREHSEPGPFMGNFRRYDAEAANNAVPMSIRVAEANARLEEVNRTTVPNILKALRKKWTEKKRRQRLLIEISNTIPNGEKSALDEVGKAMNSRFSTGIGEKIIRKDISHSTRKNRRGGWGPWGNETREEAEWRFRRGYTNLANSDLEESETERQKKTQLTFSDIDRTIK